MNLQQIEQITDKLQNESYNLTKSIEALLYRVIPADTDSEDDYTMGLLNVLSHQSKLVTELATNLSMNIAHIDYNSENTDKHTANSVDTKDMIINEIDLKIDNFISISENKLKNLDFDDSSNFANELDSLINSIDEKLEYLIYNLIEQDKLKLLKLAQQGEIQLGDLLDQEYYIDDENFSGIYDSPIDSKAYTIQTLIDNIKLTIKLIKNIDELKINEIDDKIYIYQSLLSTAVSLSRNFDELDFLISDLNLLLGYKNLEE